MSLAFAYLRFFRNLSHNARLLLVSGFLTGVAFGIFSLLVNLYLLSLGYMQDFIALLVAIPALVIALFSLPAGILGDRVSHRRSMLIGSTLIALGMGGIALSADAALLVPCSVVFGIGAALSQVIAAPFMMENSNAEQRAHLFSLQFAIFPVSGFLGSLVGGALPAIVAAVVHVLPESPTAYRGALAVASATALAAVLPLALIRRIPQEPRARGRGMHLRASSLLIGKLIFPNAVIGLGAGLFIPFLNVFFKLKFGIPDALLGTLFAGGALGMAAAALAAPPLAARWGKIRAIVTTQALSMPFLVLLGFAPIFWVAALAYLIRGALMPMTAPLYSVFIMEQVSREERATVNGISSMAWNLFNATGAYLSGQVQVTGGFAPLFAVTCIAYFIGICSTHMLLAPLEKRPAAQVHSPA